MIFFYLSLRINWTYEFEFLLLFLLVTLRALTTRLRTNNQQEYSFADKLFYRVSLLKVFLSESLSSKTIFNINNIIEEIVAYNSNCNENNYFACYLPIVVKTVSEYRKAFAKVHSMCSPFLPLSLATVSGCWCAISSSIDFRSSFWNLRINYVDVR